MMGSKYRETDLSKIKTISIRERQSKVTVDQFVDPASLFQDGNRPSRSDLRRLFPDILAGRDFAAVSSSLLRARDDGREIVWLVGAHVIKCGLSLYLRELMKERFITAIATTGSAAIHDLELAFHGETSEDVAVELPAGRFGMARETAAYFETACAAAAEGSLGLGEGIGAHIVDSPAPHSAHSVFAGAYQASVPATVHVALGTDIVHQHPSFPGGTVGELSMKDFRIFTSSVGRMFDRGAVVVFGSAVVLPEVFLKAVSVNYNLGMHPRAIMSASFDMMAQYRVSENILRRPFPSDCRRCAITGRHEIMLPLLYLMLMSGE